MLKRSVAVTQKHADLVAEGDINAEVRGHNVELAVAVEVSRRNPDGTRSSAEVLVRLKGAVAIPKENADGAPGVADAARREIGNSVAVEVPDRNSFHKSSSGVLRRVEESRDLGERSSRRETPQNEGENRSRDNSPRRADRKDRIGVEFHE